MKLLIASDLHGSAFYCQKLMEAIASVDPDRVVLLGDLLYHGPRNDLPRDYAPKEVITMLNSVADKLLCVRGNCDTEVDQMVLPFPILSDSLVIYDGKRMLYCTHGHHVTPEAPPALPEDAILLGGHTHIAEERDCGCFRYVNPGSVSIPKGGTDRGCLVYENGTFTRISWE